MTDGQTKQAKIDGKNRVDKVGETNVYPVSEMEGASDKAKVHSEASLGKSERDQEEFENSGSSKVIELGDGNEEKKDN
jgi:hypothetical protein